MAGKFRHFASYYWLFCFKLLVILLQFIGRFASNYLFFCFKLLVILFQFLVKIKFFWEKMLVAGVLKKLPSDKFVKLHPLFTKFSVQSINDVHTKLRKIGPSSPLSANCPH